MSILTCASAAPTLGALTVMVIGGKPRTVTEHSNVAAWAGMASRVVPTIAAPPRTPAALAITRLTDTAPPWILPTGKIPLPALRGKYVCGTQMSIPLNGAFGCHEVFNRHKCSYKLI